MEKLEATGRTTDRQQQGPDVVCMGEVLIDFVAKEHNVDLSQVKTYSIAAGGAPANVAVGVKRLENQLQTTFVGSVGKDPFGEKLRRELETAGVDASFLYTNEDSNKTTINFVSVWEDGHKDLCFYRGADSKIEARDVTPNLFGSEQRGCFHCGSITLIEEPGASAQRKATELARQSGWMVTYDPNYRPTLCDNRNIWEAFRSAHIAKVSEEEFAAVTGEAQIDKGVAKLLKIGVELVVVSRGEHGALAATKNFRAESPAALDLNIVETTGAGDAFMAAIITRMLPAFRRQGGSLKDIDRKNVQDALDFANSVAGLACTKAGAIPALPTADEVQRFLDRRKRAWEQRLTSTKVSLPPDATRLAGMIDHTFLKPYCVQPDDMEQLCLEASRYGFAMVAVNPDQVKTCCQLLQGSKIRVGAAIGFPLGQTTMATKVFETSDAIRNGASEIDVVMNVRRLQRGDYDAVRSEIEALLRTCRPQRVDGKKIIFKVIMETCFLSTQEKIKACEICRDAGVDFVKTSTGFGKSGATVEDIKLMKSVVGNGVCVKASGGIRDLATAKAMIRAGASRLGTSSGVAIVEEMLNNQKRNRHNNSSPPSSE